MNEVEIAIKALNNNKASSHDNLINEYFKASADILSSHLAHIFNIILGSGRFPDSWSKGVIVPVFKKKGDINSVENYRGITLISCFSKLFTSILTRRLTKWCETNEIQTEAQFGFRKEGPLLTPYLS